MTLRYSGDKNFNGDSKTININVVKSDNSGFGAEAVPNEIPYLSNTTLNAFVTNSNATGSVTYRFDDGTVVHTTTEQDWSYLYIPRSAGTHTVNVTYNGDDNFNKVSVNVTVTVTKIDAGFDAYTIRPSIIYLDNLTVYHKFNQSDVTGNVTITFANKTNKTVNVNEIIKFMPQAGTYTLNLTYSGNNNYNKATDSITFTVTKSDDSGFYVEVNPRAFSYLGNTTLKGTLKNGATGYVKFEFDDGTPSVTVAIGEEVIYTPKWAGGHNITATYLGDDNFNDNTRKINITVNRLDPNFHISDGNVKDLTFGENVTVNTVVDTKYADLVTGNVTFYFSNGTNTTVKIGESIVYTPYKAGERILRAVYDGDRNFIGSESTLTLNVKKADNSGFKANVTPGEIDFEGTAIVLGNVTNPIAGGNVTYHLPNGTNITLKVGKSITVKPETTGDYHILVDYSGDDNFNPIKDIELTLKVNKIDAGFNASANQTNIVFENGVKLNSSVSDSLANGTVTYTFDDGTPEIVKNITDVVVYVPRSAGEHNITVKYSGDGNFNDATKTITINVLKSANSGFYCIADPDVIDYKQSTTLVSNTTNSKARGTVTYIFDDGTAVVVRTDKSNWNYIYTPKSAGSHVVNVTYDGDENFEGKSFNITVTVNKIDSGFDAYNVRPSIVYRDNFTVYHNFTQSDVSGNVTVLLENGENITVKVHEIVKFMPLSAGNHTINVTYSGDGNYKNATDSITFTVTKSDDSGFYVEVNPRAFSYLGNTTLKGTLKNGATGYVKFEFDDGTPSVTVAIGEEVIYTPKWAGEHNITATYLGDGNFNDNTRIINITVNKISAGFHIRVNDSEITFEESVLISNVINNRNATGNVTLFFDDGSNQTIKLNETYVYTPCATGRHVVNATYSGDRNFNSANDNNDILIVVKKSDNAKFNASADPEIIPFENSTVLNTTLDNPNATGNVTYYFDNNTNITVPVGTPISYTPNSTGLHEVKVVYEGDGNFNGDEKVITITVNPIDAKFNATVDNITPIFNDEIHLNSTVNDTLATGNVTYIFDDGTPEINAKIGEVIPYTPQTSGEHTITVKYSGDDNFNEDEKTITINVAKAEIEVNVTVDNPTYPDNATVTVNATVDGIYNVTVGNKTYQVKVENGTGNVTIDVLPAGEHQVNVTAEIPNYKPVNNTDNKITVSNGTISINLYPKDIAYPSNLTIKVNVNVTGDYIINVSEANIVNKTVHLTANNETVINLGQVPAGKYSVNITSNIKNYNVASAQEIVNVTDGKIDFNVTVVDPTYPDNATIIVNSTIDGNYTVTVDNNHYNVTVKNGTGNVTLPVLPAGNYTVNVTSNVPNYEKITKDANLTVGNGTIGLELTVDLVDYPSNVTAVIKTNVTGQYIVTVDGKDPQVVYLVNGTPCALDLGVLPAGNHTVRVVSNITNYNVAENSTIAAVNNGTIKVNVTVNPADYPGNATITVNATIDGNYTVKVGNGTYNVTVKNGTGNVTLPVLPAGNYTVNVTGEIPNYSPVNEPGENLIIGNGTIDLKLDIKPVDYPSNVTAVIKTNVTGQYIVTVDGKDPQVVDLVNGTPCALDLGVLPAGNHTVRVVSNITNYNIAENSTTASVNNGTINITVEVINAKYPEPGKVIVKADVDGDYTVNVNGTDYTAHVVDGTGNVTINVLPTGEYPVKVTAEIPNYNPVDKDGKLVVSNSTIEMNVTVCPADYPSNATVIVNSTVDGNYTVTVDNKTYPVEVINGTGNVTLPVLTPGNYTVNVTSNVANYEKVTKTDNLTISNGTIGLELTVNPVSYPDNVAAVIKTNVTGEYIITVDDGEPIKVTLTNSTPNEVDLGVLPAGNHTVKVESNIENYNKVEDTKKATVNPGKVDMNVTVINPTYLDNATVIVNSTVDGNYTVTVDNKTYSVEVKNGTGNVTIDQLPQGKHNVVIESNITNYENTTKTAEVDVALGKLDYNVTVTNPTYPDKAQVTITSNVDGDYVVEVNGKQYDAKVVNGKATVDVDELPAGTYPVKVTSKVPNYETTAKEATLTVKAASVVEDNVKLKVTLRDADGKVLKNKKVVFTYNGKTFTVKTNSKGVATITVKKSDTQTNDIINLKKVNGKKVKATWISKFKYSIKFKDKKGNAIAGKKVTIKFNGKVYKVKTNKKGVATVIFKNIKSGKYKIVAKYKKIVHKATVNIKG